jgi:hypothetical protein
MLTLFTWGYDGWGNQTSRLLEAVDAVEASRAFKPPVFVDIRIRRSVRAKGFTGAAFEKLLGPNRHRWMKTLGNQFIETRTGPRIQIANPSSVNDLLDLALSCAGQPQNRILFFCSCAWPKCDGEIACHRAKVAELVLHAANQRGVAVEVVEWPGGERTHIDLNVPLDIFTAVRKGRLTIPLGRQIDLSRFAGLPSCSTVTLHSSGGRIHRIVGPAIWKRDQWVLPVWYWFPDPDAGLENYQREAKRLRWERGLDPASAETTTS